MIRTSAFGSNNSNTSGPKVVGTRRVPFVRTSDGVGNVPATLLSRNLPGRRSDGTRSVPTTLKNARPTAFAVGPGERVGGHAVGYESGPPSGGPMGCLNTKSKCIRRANPPRRFVPGSQPLVFQANEQDARTREPVAAAGRNVTLAGSLGELPNGMQSSSHPRRDHLLIFTFAK